MKYFVDKAGITDFSPLDMLGTLINEYKVKHNIFANELAQCILIECLTQNLIEEAAQYSSSPTQSDFKQKLIDSYTSVYELLTLPLGEAEREKSIVNKRFYEYRDLSERLIAKNEMSNSIKNQDNSMAQ